MPFAVRSRFSWKLRTRSLDLGERTAVMGVINMTPDSFSDGGSYGTSAAGIEQALYMFDQGADIVDVGGESTRPGNRKPVSVQQEVDRVLPVIEGILRHRPGSILSLDTYKAETAKAGLGAGVEIINDVSGFLWEESLGGVCARSGCGVVLMHTRGRPAEWQALPALEPKQIVPMVARDLEQRFQAALGTGIERERIAVDPGFGFGKVFDENFTLLAGLEELASLGLPILAGVSRKGFLGRALAPLYGGKDALVERRAAASVAATTAAILAGAQIVRVHEVRPSREAALTADALLKNACS